MANYIVHLTGGQSIPVYAYDSEIDSIYDLFQMDANMIHFENGSFKVKHIAGLEYVTDEASVKHKESFQDEEYRDEYGAK